jgi:hypothetical protein
LSSPRFEVGDRVIFKKHKSENIRLRIFVVKNRLGPLPRYVYLLGVDWTRNAKIVECLSRNWIEEKDLELAPCTDWDSEAV